MFKTGGVIRRRVMQVLEQKLEEAENRFVDGCEAIDEQAAQKKSELLENVVDELVSKFE